MVVDKDKPFYPISMVAELVNVSSDRIRTYEEEFLVFPTRGDKKKMTAGKRLFTQLEIEWLKLIRDLIKTGMSIASIRTMIRLSTCCDVKKLEKITFSDNDKFSADKTQLVIIKQLINHPVYKNIIDKL